MKQSVLTVAAACLLVVGGMYLLGMGLPRLFHPGTKSSIGTDSNRPG